MNKNNNMIFFKQHSASLAQLSSLHGAHFFEISPKHQNQMDARLKQSTESHGDATIVTRLSDDRSEHDTTQLVSPLKPKMIDNQAQTSSRHLKEIADLSINNSLTNSALSNVLSR